MATQSRSRVSPGTPTLEQAFVRLVLLASPLLLLYLLGMGAVVILARDGWRLLALVIGLSGLVGLLRLLGGCIVEVPYLQAVILSQRNNLRLEALLKGFHLRAPLLYKRLAQVSLRPSEGELVLQHVAVQGGPLLTLRVPYTLRPVISQHAHVLPRTNLGEAFHTRDLRMIGFLFLAHSQPERWRQVSTNEIEGALRTFLKGVQIAELYDPLGQPRDTGELIRRLDVHLATTVEPGLGFNVHIHAVEILDGEKSGMLAWYQHWIQLQQLAGLTQNLTPEQALVMAELFERLAGTGGHGGTDPALYLLLSQIGYNNNKGPGGESPPRAQWQPQEPPPLRPSRGRTTGPDRPAA